jgi:hypothetical protein
MGVNNLQGLPMGSGWEDLLNTLQEFVSGQMPLGSLNHRIQELEQRRIPDVNRFWLDFDVLLLSVLCSQCRAEIRNEEAEDPIEAAQFFLDLIAAALSGREPYEYGFIFGPEGEEVNCTDMPAHLAQIARLLEDVVEKEIEAANKVTKATLARLLGHYQDLHATSLGATILRNQCKAILPTGIYEGFLSIDSLRVLINQMPDDGGVKMNQYRLRRFRACKSQFHGLSSVAVNVTICGSVISAFSEPVED